MDKHTFNSTGEKPGPARAALIAKARKRISQPWANYQIISLCGDGTQCGNLYDIVEDKEFDHILVARSNIEALVAFLDYLNESVPTEQGRDHYETVDANDLSKFMPYFDHDPENDVGLWFRKIPAMRIAHHVSELSDSLPDDGQEDWRRGQTSISLPEDAVANCHGVALHGDAVANCHGEAI